mmetsp:Transcript_11734/g.25379  ORF Transcript_11734/g.25379 Transcript_11734/m.25379 type:complete len:541 (-) Transcript_11734:1935-3557(-)
MRAFSLRVPHYAAGVAYGYGSDVVERCGFVGSAAGEVGSWSHLEHSFSSLCQMYGFYQKATFFRSARSKSRVRHCAGVRGPHDIQASMRDTFSTVAGPKEQGAVDGNGAEIVAVIQFMEALTSYLEAKSEPLSGLQAVREKLSPSMAWNSELFTDQTSDEAVQQLVRLREFFEKVRLQFEFPRKLTKSSSPNAFGVEWTLSGTWPLPWRPRVVVSGSSTVTVCESEGGDFLVNSVEDSWEQSIGMIYRQLLPRFGDVFELYTSPHAEYSTTTRRVLRTAADKSYTIWEDAPGEEIRAKQNAQEVSDAWFAVPTAPPDAFAGRIKRAEVFTAVSPICVSRRGSDYEWRVAVPTELRGGNRCRVNGDVVQVVKHGRRQIAVGRRFGGFATSARAFDEAYALISRLRLDGVLEGDPKDAASIEAVVRSPIVRLASYDVKAGFNSRGEFAIVAFVSHLLQRRRNEIWVELEREEDGILSGAGNGEVVLDKKEQAVPSPVPIGPDIEGAREEAEARREERRLMRELFDEDAEDDEDESTLDSGKK